MNFLQGKIIRQNEWFSLQLHDQVISIKSELTNFNLKDIQQDVILGIRPHDLSLQEKGDFTCSGAIKYLEPLGHSTLVSVQVGDSLVRCFADSRYNVELGTIVELSARAESIHIFDQATSQTLKQNESLSGKAEQIMI